MKIEQISKNEVIELSYLLVKYWKERGMEYDLKCTEQYLIEGHKNELKDDITFSVKNDGILIGIISVVVFEGDLAELRDFVIKEGMRGQGYGTKTLKLILDWCKDNQIRKVMSLIFPKHEQFLAKLGFAREGYLKDHFINGEDLLIMSKKL